MNSLTYNMDCMDFMKDCKNKQFDLAIVDPPYGIGENGKGCSRHRGGEVFTCFEAKEWDNIKPNGQYFNNLFRISNNQIVWGGNYFTEFLPSSMGWIFWNKLISGDFSDGELAFTSFDRALKMFIQSIERNRATNILSAEKWKRIHPTQKPVKLYKWLLKNYAKEGDTILDTHLGSGSSRIACYDYGFDFTGIELDKDYFDAEEKRFKNHISQTRMFVPAGVNIGECS